MWEYIHCVGGGNNGAFKNNDAASALLNKLELGKVWGVRTPWKEDWTGCGDGVGEPVTEISSSDGDNGAGVVMCDPVATGWSGFGDAFGDVVLCALQFIDIGPRFEDDAASGKLKKNNIVVVSMILVQTRNTGPSRGSYSYGLENGEVEWNFGYIQWMIGSGVELHCNQIGL